MAHVKCILKPEPNPNPNYQFLDTFTSAINPFTWSKQTDKEVKKHSEAVYAYISSEQARFNGLSRRPPSWSSFTRSVGPTAG